MEYIIEFNPYKEENIDMDYYAEIERKLLNSESISQNEAEDYLRVLNYIVRKNINSNFDNYDYKCDLAQSILCQYFQKINCKYNACATHKEITSGIDGHSFTIVTLPVEGENKSYIMDPTYIQFFHKEKCQKSNYFISPKFPDIALLTPDAGYFIKEEDKEPIDFLLRYGYIELTPEYARIYGDSFLNTKTGVNIEELEFKSIPGDVYINAFLKGKEPLSRTEEQLSESMQQIIMFNNFDKQQTISKKA